jgi:hypothetical protein
MPMIFLSEIHLSESNENPGSSVAEKSTPLGIVLIGIFSILFGLMSILGGIGLIARISLYGWMGPIIGVTLLLAGITESVFGMGCILAWQKAWFLGFLIMACGILLQGIFLFSIGQYGSSLLDINNYFWSYFGLALTGMMLWYLFQPHVMEYFGRS